MKELYPTSPKSGAWDLYATAISFPSLECLNEKGLSSERSGIRGMVPNGLPVWRSQLMSVLLTHSVKQRPSGEKPSCGGWREVSDEVSKMESLLRVTASRTSTDFSLV